MSSPKKLKTLYVKVGEDSFRAILHDFYQRMARDTLIGFFFYKKDVIQIANQQHQFIQKAIGVRKTYTGKSPTTAHIHLPPILRGHFHRRLTLLRETLQDHQWTPSDIETWIGFEKAFEDAIVS